MGTTIISDVHANLAALESIEESYDQLFCPGDLVDYGPQPSEAIQWVRRRALKFVRGNHDHALGYAVDCRCAPVMREASVSTREWHSRLLSCRKRISTRPADHRAVGSGGGYVTWHMPRRPGDLLRLPRNSGGARRSVNRSNRGYSSRLYSSRSYAFAPATHHRHNDDRQSWQRQAQRFRL